VLGGSEWPVSAQRSSRFSPSTLIRSADVNSNLAALNGASAPSFTTITVSGLATVGKLTSDGGKITSDGAGNLSIVGLTATGTISGAIAATALTLNGNPVPITDTAGQKIWTGTTAPSSPNIGDIWIKA